MERRAGAHWQPRATGRCRGAGGLLRRLLPSEHAARGGAPGHLPRHPRRARALRPRGEAARGSAAARISPLAPVRSEGTQAALGGRRPAADADRGMAGRGGRLADMGPDQLGYPVVEGHPWRQAGRGAATASAGHPRQRAGEHRGVQGPRARRQAPGGKALGVADGPLRSEWLPGQFSRLLEELVERHKAARNRAGELSGERWAQLEPTVPHRITQRMMKRVISVLREARHGGTVIFIPLENAGEPSREHPYIDLRYRFADSRARLSFPDLIVTILNRLAQLYGTADHEQEPTAVGWEEFEATTDAQIETLDEALFDVAHLIADLAAADGAVVMSKDNELLGLEGEKVAEEETGDVGARHRSAYRLAGALPGSVAVVISQDGGVRWVCQKGGRVTYWEQE